MMNYLVKGIIYWINELPSKNEASNTIGPAGNVIGRPQSGFNIKRIAFGAYAISYSKTKNDMISRGVPEISLIPPNDQGGNYFCLYLWGNALTHIVGRNFQ